MYSLWCDALYRLSIAHHFRERGLWFPHNMDFRGRVYPIPPHLNHMGSDLAKSLLGRGSVYACIYSVTSVLLYILFH
jgi:DNA-directed RNA polymerase